jgi:lysozyme
MKLQEIIDGRLTVSRQNFDPELIKEIQTHLNYQGVGLVVDGFYGTKTDQAIADFCKAAYLNSSTNNAFGPSFSKALLEVPQSGRKINAAGLALIKNFEGCETEAYNDGVGVATIGFGHTVGVKMGQKITVAEAEDYLKHDLGIYEKAVCKAVKIKINDNQFSALVSFSFNVGVRAMTGSTLVRVLNAGNPEIAADNFLSWTYGGGHQMAGLVRRRQAEKSLFLKSP